MRNLLLFNLWITAGLMSFVQSCSQLTTALVKVQNDILRAMDKEEVILLLLLDLSAAFDNVNHNILLDRLSSRFGVQSTLLRWFESYLKGLCLSTVLHQTLRN